MNTPHHLLFIGTAREVEALGKILEEYNRAQKLHPNWPVSRIEEVAVVAEEAGEAVKAALNLRVTDNHFEKSSVDEYKTELTQTGAMAFRALVNTRDFK